MMVRCNMFNSKWRNCPFWIFLNFLNSLKAFALGEGRSTLVFQHILLAAVKYVLAYCIKHILKKQKIQTMLHTYVESS